MAEGLGSGAASRQEKLSNPSPSEEMAAPSVSLEQAAKLIAFALSELGSENAHHEFEHLCRHVTRRRICPNIVPATGPVSAGGDQGADFESYRTSSASQPRTQFFSKAVQEKWLFACSLEKNYKKKIRSDLKAAKDFHEKVDRLVFFHNRPIPVSVRHKLQKEGIETYGIELEIFDSKALSEMLADHETVWIAQRFLSLPSEFLLARDEQSPEWFQEVLIKGYDVERLTSADFFELKDAIRFATKRSEYHSALPKLLSDIRLFRRHPFEKIRRKAVYEEFVAHLRGLDSTSGLEDSIREFLAGTEKLDDPAELEDAAVFLGYCLGAFHHGVLDLSLPELSESFSKLTNRVSNLKASTDLPGRSCHLLFILGFLSLSGYLTKDSEVHCEIETSFQRSADSAAKIWLELTRQAEEAPLFPIERLAQLVNEFIAPIRPTRVVDQLVRKVDALSVKRSGHQKFSQNLLARAHALIERNQYLRALSELHKAHEASFVSGETFEVVKVCLQIGELYAKMGLQFAAKYYGLASCYAALRLPGDDLRKLAYLGCAHAAEANHAAGGSLNFFLTAQIFAFTATEYSMGGSEERVQFEGSRMQFYATLIARASGLVSRSLQQVIINRMLPLIGLGEFYREVEPQFDGYFENIKTLGDLEQKATQEGIAPPFSDVGGRRRVAWKQLRIEWHFEWETSFEVDRQAQALVADLQIFLAEFAKDELSIIPGQLHATIEVHDGKLEIQELPDNDVVRRKIRLPRAMPEGEAGIAGYAFAVASTLIKTVSAMSEEEFFQILGRHFSEGLMSRINRYKANELLFDEFYVREVYDELYLAAKSAPVGDSSFAPDTWKELQGPQGLHPLYRPKDSLVAVQMRYDRLTPMTLDTIKRLSNHSEFSKMIVTLRQEGWKDWHILTGIEGVRFNYILNHVPYLRAAMDADNLRLVERVRRSEANEDRYQVPIEAFSLEEMKRNVRLSQLATLRGYGLSPWQPTPNFEGINELLSRFRYWDDDLPHEDPFRGLVVTGCEN